MNNTSILKIFDIVDSDFRYEGNFIYWTNYKGSQYKNTILYYVEQNAFRFRAKYLDYIASIKVNSGKKTKFFCFKDGFDFWQMSSIIEKSYIKSDSIHEIICLLALEEIISIRKYTSIYIATENNRLIKTIREFCKKSNINLKIKKVVKSRTELKKKHIFLYCV
jgi:surface carbohydrate biosynthesis protein (TIGR04326 family)